MKSIRVGTSGWAYTSWKPSFYPPKTPASKLLNYYATQLNCVEVNFTFRQRPAASTLEGWIAATPETFSFVTKAHQRITHIKRLKEVEADVLGLFESLRPLSAAGRLGPVLFQLPPNLKMDLNRLSLFLQHLPPGMRAAMEFRHESWWNEEVFNAMREHDVALCVAESDELQAPDVHTASFSYFRFRKSDYSQEALDQIANRLAQQAREREVYAFMKHEETPEGALNARRLLQTLSQVQQSERAA